MTYEIGDAVICDYGSGYVVGHREGEEGQDQLGVVFDGALVWVDSDTVEMVPG